MGSTFGGGIRSTKPVDLSSNNGSLGFRAANPRTFDTGSGFSRRNLLAENSNQPSSMSQFAPPANDVDLPDSYNPPQFNGNNERRINRRNRPEGEGCSELEQQNFEVGSSSFAVTPPFPKNRSFSTNAGNVRMQQPFQAEKSPGQQRFGCFKFLNDITNIL